MSLLPNLNLHTVNKCLHYNVKFNYIFIQFELFRVVIFERLSIICNTEIYAYNNITFYNNNNNNNNTTIYKSP